MSERAIPTTSWPCACSAATAADPIHPDAPVTKTCMVLLLLRLERVMSGTDVTVHAHVSDCHRYAWAVVRWQPGAKERLQLAAIGLFLDHGFEQTTVQEIAQEAGLTERTFFRHFADKREVLFVGQEQYVAAFLNGMRAAPEGTAAFGLVAAALTGAAEFFPAERRPWSAQRQQVIDANPALQERESLKRVSLGDAITAGLGERGIGEPDARLVAELGVTVFHVAFRTWIEHREARPLREIVEEVLARIPAIVPDPA